MGVTGRAFYKMTGSGNDFVVFDARSEPAGELATVPTMQTLCARGTGIGADGVVFIQPSSRADYFMKYFNSDGSPAELCGNASLCSAQLAVRLGIVSADGFSFESDAGILRARIRGGEPEVDLEPVTEVRPDAGIPRTPGETALGYAVAGNPHLVTLCGNVDDVDLASRGRRLRHDPSLPKGANANFVSPAGSGWRMRTFERGVEGETLACGTGAVASAILLTAWEKVTGPVSITTRSGKTLTVRLRQEGSQWLPSLRGEGRLVFEGVLGQLS